MAHVYSITDGTTTVTLSQANGYLVTGFVLDAPEISTREIISEGIDGSELPAIAYRNVTQTIEILFIGTSTSNLQTLIHAVENMLYKAHRRQTTKAGARVYLQIQIDSEASTWRSEILTGKLRLGDEALQQWIDKKPEGQLTVTRRFFWEGPETELQLSTSNQSAATGGRTIYNHDDSDTGHDNWVQIAAAQVGGVLPTPVKLELTNSTGSSVGYRNIYLAVNAYSDPGNFTHILEGESRISGYGTITTNAASSGGNYNSYSFSSTGTMLWTLSATIMQDTQGRWFRLLARFFAWSGTDIYIKPILRDSTGLLPLWEGDEISLGSTAASSTKIIDMGALPLPVGGYQGAWGTQVLGLLVRATGSAQIDLDFMQLTPLDSYRYVVQRGNTIINSGTITDDNIEGLTHAGGDPIYSPKTGALMLFPNQLQRIIVLQDIGTSSTIANTFSVRAYIRERRLTV